MNQIRIKTNGNPGNLEDCVLTQGTQVWIGQEQIPEVMALTIEPVIKDMWQLTIKMRINPHGLIEPLEKIKES